MTKYGVLPDEIDSTVCDVPDECPVCHYAIDPRFIAYHPEYPNGLYSSRFQVVFACPRGECGHVFVAYYKQVDSTQYLDRCLPMVPKEPDVPVLVASISERFVEVYKQAEAAHSYQLDEVAGGGYRKALEVLVKDFLVVGNGRSEESVIKMTLADAVKALPDEVVKNLAHFTKLLGNDETHYYRKWADRDIEDVKTYLIATITAFNLYLLHQEGKDEFGAAPKDKA
jgi:hypothetical protein